MNPLIDGTAAEMISCTLSMLVVALTLLIVVLDEKGDKDESSSS